MELKMVPVFAWLFSCFSNSRDWGRNGNEYNFHCSPYWPDFISQLSFWDSRWDMKSRHTPLKWVIGLSKCRSVIF